MSKTKIRVLIIPSDPYGVGHFRSIWPAQCFEKNHSDEFYVDIRLAVPITDDDLGNFDIVHFHRRINEPEKTIEWIKKFEQSGAIVISDVDDYWTPFHGHPAEQLAKQTGLHVEIMNVQRAANWVTTTTELYRRHILKLNKNVHIIPNAVDHHLEMWQMREIQSDRVRIGWIGGSSHMRDLERLRGTFNLLLNDPDVKDKIQIVMCGYDTRGSVTEINPITKEQKSRPIRPEESVWNKFEEIFNDNGRANSDQYVRRTTLPITKYGNHYDYIDVCLAPLAQHTFNECKSELKIIETGMKGKALIASDLYIYKRLLTHGENALLIDPRKDHKDWYKYIKQIILDNDLRKKLQTNLRTFVYPRYTLDEVTRQRAEFYKEVLREKKTVS